MSADVLENGSVVFLGDLTKLVVNPGDTLVLQSSISLTSDQVESLRESMVAQFPNNKILVLDNHLKLGVLTEGQN